MYCDCDYAIFQAPQTVGAVGVAHSPTNEKDGQASAKGHWYPFVGMRGSGSVRTELNTAAATFKKFWGSSACHLEVRDTEGDFMEPAVGADYVDHTGNRAGMADSHDQRGFAHRERLGATQAEALLRLSTRCYRGALQALGREHARDACDVDDKRQVSC